MIPVTGTGRSSVDIGVSANLVLFIFTVMPLF